MSDFRETGICTTSEDKHATVSSSEAKWINKINKLHEKYPNEVEIIYTPEQNCGTIYAHVPKNWVKISPPRQVNYTDEQKAAMVERLAAARNKQND